MSDDNRQIKKIHFKNTKAGKLITIGYDIKDRGDVKSTVFKSEDEPLSSFIQSMEALKACMVGIFQFTPKYAENLEVRGVSLSYQGEDERLGVVFSGVMTRDTASRPFNLHTPLLFEPSEDGENEGPTLSVACLNKIEDLISEAFDYLDGKRAPKPEQLKLVS